jgi:nitroimidazol reductase NimA-like FMN-containing flavoprotein (pyridoxamine 5'-phosphate oxidase superfamily)
VSEYDAAGGSGTNGPGGDPADPTPAPSDRTRVRRLPKRGHYDRATLDAILDEGIVAHVGWVDEGQPFATPTIAWRRGDRLYWHGSSASRMLRATDGRAVCVTVTHLDGLVLARSGFNHSVNYRSAMVLGIAHLVTDPHEAERALEVFIEHLYPGRWAELRPMTSKEKKATTVLWMDLDEASAKIRDDVNHDDPGDEAWSTWAGIIPIRTELGDPRADPLVAAGTPAPVPALPARSPAR